KADSLAQHGLVEERILLLIAQHFQRGFAEDGEIKRAFPRRRIGENDLMRQRGFAATRRARDDVEGKFRDAAAKDFVEAAHAGRQFADRDLSRLAHDSFLLFAFSRANFHFITLYQGTVSTRPRAPTAALNLRQ